MSDVGSDRLRNTHGFLTKNVKEIFWDLKFLSEVTGSTVYIFIYRCKNVYINGANLFQMKEHNWK